MTKSNQSIEIDISVLLDMADGDNLFTSSTLKSFQTEFESDLNELYSTNFNDTKVAVESIRQFAHKYKPNLHYIRIDALLTRIVQLRELSDLETITKSLTSLHAFWHKVASKKLSKLINDLSS